MIQFGESDPPILIQFASGTSIADGDQVVIDLSTPHTVTYWTGGIGGTPSWDAYNWLDQATTSWPTLLRGGNTLSFSAAQDSIAAGALECWRRRLLFQTEQSLDEGRHDGARSRVQLLSREKPRRMRRGRRRDDQRSRVAEKIRMLRDHGQAKKYVHDVEGYNGRLDSIQAGFLHAKLPYLEEWNNLRRDRAADYNRLLSRIGR